VTAEDRATPAGAGVGGDAGAGPAVPPTGEHAVGDGPAPGQGAPPNADADADADAADAGAGAGANGPAGGPPGPADPPREAEILPPDPLLPVAAATGRSWRRTAGWLAIFAIVVTLPLWVGDTVAGFLVELLVVVAVAQWWGLLAGHAGVLSLMPAVFAGVGTYTWAALATSGGLNPVLAVGGAATVAAVAGVATGLVAQRLPLAWVAIGGLIASAGAAALAVQVDDVGSRAEGRVVSAATTLGPTLRSSLTTWLAVVVGVGSVAAAVALRRSRYGLAAVAHRDDPEAAATLGIRSGPPRLAMWALGAVATGMAAAIVAFRAGVVRPAESFDFTLWTVPAMVAATIGGLRTVAGPAVGALIFVAADRVFGDGHHGLMLATAAAASLAVLAWAPQGIVGWATTRLGSPAAVWAAIEGWRAVNRRATSTPTAPPR
jgi:branched-chain amino acid transport system permease protein